MFSSNFLARGKAALQGSETEQKLVTLLYDDSVQVLSSFELNQVASLTFHEGSIASTDSEDLCEKIFNMLEGIMSSPATHSPISIQKSLVVARHVLLFGADKVINYARILGRHVEALLSFNTVLLAQQLSSATSMFYRIKGGGVDKGGPVREAALQLHDLLTNPQLLQHERQNQADPNSLVPIGNLNQVAFVTDEVRHVMLKQRMEEQQRMHIKSNLVKAEGGFGSGYMSKDGKAVVGAAHGLEEMIKMAEREKQRFADDGSNVPYRPPDMGPELSDRPSSRSSLSASSNTRPPISSASQDVDLLAWDTIPAPAQSSMHAHVDLLGISTETPLPQTSPSTHDLLGSGYGSVDNLSTSTMTSNNHLDIFAMPTTPAVSDTAELLGLMSLAPTTSVPKPATTSVFDVSPSAESLGRGTPTVVAKVPVMSFNQTRTSALDDLDPFPQTTPPTASSNTVAHSIPGTLNGSGLQVGDGMSTSTTSISPTLPVYDLSLCSNSPGPSLMGTTGLLNLSSPTLTQYVGSVGEEPRKQEINFGSLQVSSASVPPISWGVDTSHVDANVSSGFVMGGGIGTGLEPAAAAPSCPPPPPPPSMFG